MINGPSFTNLDQSTAESSVKDIQNTINTQMNNIQNNTVKQTKEAMNDIANTIKNLQNAINNTDLMSGMKSQLEETAKMYETLKQKSQESIYSQQMDIEKFVGQITIMKESFDKAESSLKQFNSISVGDPQKLDEFIKRISDMKYAFESLTTNTNIIDVKDEQIDEARGKIVNFLKSVSNDAMQAFNLTDGLISATGDPRIAESFIKTFEPINQMLSNIPERLTSAVNSAQASINNGTTVASGNNDSFKDVIQALNMFTGEIKKNNSEQPQVHGVVPFGARQDEVDKRQSTMNDINIETIKSKIDRIAMSEKLAGSTDKGMNNINESAMNVESKISDMLLKYQSGFSSKEKKQLKEAGIDDSSLRDTQSQVIAIQKIMNQYNSQNGSLGNAVKGFEKSASNFNRDPDGQSPESLQNLLNMANSIDVQTEAAMKTLSEALSIANGLASSINIDPEAFEKLPSEFKEAINSMKSMMDSGNGSAQSTLKFTETFRVHTDGASNKLTSSLKESTGLVSNLSSTMGEVGTASDGAMSKLLGGLGKAAGVVKGIGSTIGGMGTFMSSIGLGIGFNGIKGTMKDVTEYYKEFGRMDVASAASQMAQGSNGINERALNTNREVGKELYAKTYGQIGLGDFAEVANSLVKNVQGHNGQGANKEQGVEDMYSMAKPALEMQKLYGVDATSTVSTFYKELNLSASATNRLMLDLANSAQAANIPVDTYIKTVASLGEKFKDLGINLSVADTGMRNLTATGMSLNDATGMVSQTGQAMSNYTSDTGATMFYGTMAGISDNHWEASKIVKDRWNADGSIKPEATEAIMSGLDAQVNMKAGLYGDSPFAQWIGVQDTFGGMGYGQQQSAMLANAYQSGDKEVFKDLFENLTPEAENQSVTLKNQSDLEDKLIAAASETDELTKASVKLQSVEQNLATINKGILDMVGKSLQSVVATLGASILKLDKTIFGQFNNLSGGLSAIGGLIKGLLEHPILAVLTAIAGKMGIKMLANATSSAARTAYASGGTRAALSAGGKVVGKAVPIIGGVIDAGLTYGESKAEGKTDGYAIGEAAGAGIGTAGGIYGGAAIGTMIFPGVGTVIGGAIGGLVGSYAGKKATTLGMDAAGVQEYEIGAGTDAMNNFGTYDYSNYNTGSTYNTTADGGSLSNYQNEFNAMSGYNQTDNNNLIANVEATTTLAQGTEKLKAEQQNTNKQIEDLNTNQGSLIDKGNTIASYSYSLNQTKYTDMIEKAKDQLAQLTNIAKITDAGFTFLDKMLNAIYKVLETGSIVSNGSNNINSSGNSGNSINNINNSGNSGNSINSNSNVNAAIVNPQGVISHSGGGGGFDITTGLFKSDLEKGLEDLKNNPMAKWGTTKQSGGSSGVFGDNTTGLFKSDLTIALENIQKNPMAKWGTPTINNTTPVIATPVIADSNITYQSPVTTSQLKTNSTAKPTNAASAAPIYINGSVEYSNGTQHYDANAFKNIPGDTYTVKDGQAMARNVYEKAKDSYGLSGYSAVIDSYDDKSSAYNKKSQQNFKININVNDSSNSDYDAMASEMQAALTSIAQQYMGSSAKIASAGYDRMADQY